MVAYGTSLRSRRCNILVANGPNRTLFKIGAECVGRD